MHWPTLPVLPTDSSSMISESSSALSLVANVRHAA